MLLVIAYRRRIFQAGVTSNYSYDALYELKQVTQAANTTENYTYDPVGNRLSSLTAATMSYNSSNELTATPSTSYTYDANGNTTSKTDSTGTTTYAWDFENRLTSVTLPGTGGVVTFKYDPLGRRIYKSSSAGTSVFAYDGADLIEETNASATVVARYTKSDELDEPLAELRSATTSYYEADGLGSVSSLTSVAGAVANTYIYDSYGNLTNSSSSVSNPFSYAGREFDSETGLFYYRARYYDPSSGRFASEDPLLFSGGDVNFYAYVGGDPVDYADPFGTDRMCHFPRLCGNDMPPAPPKWLPIHSLPPGSILFTSPGGQTVWVPPGTDWCQECADAKKNGRSLSAAYSSVAQGGKYDYQRDQTNHTVNSNFQEAANYSAGVYMQCEGFTRTTTMGIGKLNGLFNSLNVFNSTQRAQWTKWLGAGWDAANSGAFSKSNCPTCK
jgi:RHS repeat-associated protein